MHYYQKIMVVFSMTDRIGELDFDIRKFGCKKKNICFSL